MAHIYNILIDDPEKGDISLIPRSIPIWMSEILFSPERCNATENWRDTTFFG